MSILDRALRRGIRLLVRGMAPKDFERWISALIVERANQLPPDDGLRLLFGIDSRLYSATGKLSIRYGEGVHTKHRHMRYHDFFVERIEAGQHVLDFGCGKGELTYNIAERAGAIVYGIEINPSSFKRASEGRAHPNITYVLGDGTKDLPPDKHFDVIVMSNVLEHLEDRPGTLRTLRENHTPHKFLIRVPSYQRDWRVPLRDELGVDYRLDDTHTIEYTHETFREETAAAGLVIDEVIAVWGEIWASLHPKEAT